MQRCSPPWLENTVITGVLSDPSWRLGGRACFETGIAGLILRDSKAATADRCCCARGEGLCVTHARLRDPAALISPRCIADKEPGRHTPLPLPAGICQGGVEYLSRSAGLPSVGFWPDKLHGCLSCLATFTALNLRSLQPISCVRPCAAMVVLCRDRRQSEQYTVDRWLCAQLKKQA